MDENIKLLKVSSKSKPNSVAGAIAGMIRSSSRVQIQTIGAGALNQAIKGIAIARGFIAPTGHELICIPYFKDIEVNGEVKTAIVLTVESK
jgi:stage V sporulation protein S